MNGLSAGSGTEPGSRPTGAAQRQLPLEHVEQVREARQRGDDRQELGVLARPQLDPVEPRERRQILQCGRLDPLVAAAHALLPP